MSTTLGAIFQDKTADGHGDVNLDVGRPAAGAVRETRTSTDDWYQVALTAERLPAVR